MLLFLGVVSSSANTDSLMARLPYVSGLEKVTTSLALAKALFSNDITKSEKFTDMAIELASSLKNDSLRSKAYQQKADILRRQGAYNESISYLYKSLELLKHLGQEEELSRAYTKIGTAYSEMGDYKLSIEYYMKSLDIKKKINDLRGKGICLFNIGNVYNNWSNFERALDYYQQAESIFDEIHYEEGLAFCLNSNGLIYENWGNYDKALACYEKAVEIVSNGNNLYALSDVYNNIGNAFTKQLKYEKALGYYGKSEEIKRSLGDQAGIASALQNIGNVYTYLAKYDDAKPFYEEALDISEKIENKYMIITTLTSIGWNDIKLGKCQSALVSLTKSEKISKELGLVELLQKNYTFISEAYECIEGKSKALTYFMKASQLKDSIFNQQKFNQLSELQTKYETERIEQEIVIKNLELQDFQKENERQRSILYFVIGGLMIILLFSVLLYRLFTAKKKANKILESQNIEIQQKNEEISAQRDEIGSQRDMVIRQHEQITIIHEELKDSIQYAKRIQKAILPSFEYADRIMTDYFIFFKPKDVVSGDFFWMTEIGNKLIITAADCTGHGVPGAFMSMLSVAFLNDIVRKDDTTLASRILTELRKNIIDAFKQSGKGWLKQSSDISITEQRDGLDMALCILDTETYEMQFSGANNPLWIIRHEKYHQKQSLDNPMQALEEIKGDRMPIGNYERMDEFTNHKISLSKGDTCYIFSDGYADQFGGPVVSALGGKKFKYKAFKELIINLFSLPMKEQKKVLDKSLEDWMGFINPNTGKPYEQIDDICVIGLRI